MTDITYTFEFPHWVVKPRVGAFKHVVTEVHWRLHASDGENTATVFGSVKLPAPTDTENYVAKDDVTEEQLIEWVKPLIGYDKYLPNLQNHLISMKAENERPVAEVPAFARKP